MHKHLIIVNLQTDLGSSNQETDATELFKDIAPYEDISGNLISGLGIFILFLSVAIIIIVIAVVIKYKMRKSDSKIDTDNAIEVIELPDPYQQAIVFPNDPKPNWPVYIKKSFKDAGKKIMGKGDPPHRTTIPEHLKPQLKHIYVY